MKITIENADKFNVTVEGEPELCSSVIQTTLYFVGVADWKMKKEQNEEPIKENEMPKSLEETLNLSPRAFARAPNNTALLLNWLEHRKTTEFDIQEFMNEYPTVDKTSVEKIVAYQIKKGNLLQLSNRTFKCQKERI